MDLVVRNAKIRGRIKPVDVGIEDGKIVKIAPRIKGRARDVVEAMGRLTSPAFIEPHIHLDKVLTSEKVRASRSGTLQEAIEILWDAKRKYSVQDVKRRAGQVIELEALNGATRLRTHVDVDTIGGLTACKALLGLKKEYADVMDIQVIAFPQEGILLDEGAEELMRKAMEMGADVVGGMPHAEMTRELSMKHVDILFEIAREYNADIDAHVDETDDPSSRCMEYMAAKTIENGYQGRVTADHVCALASYDDYHAEKVIRLLKLGNITVETNPETNLVVQGRLDTYPKRRGLTRVKELVQSGVNVTYGQDCICDAFYPFGKADLLQTGFVLALAAQMTAPSEIEAVFDMITTNAAKAMRITPEYGIQVGKRADLVIIDAVGVPEALRLQPDRLWVIKEGKVIAENRSSRKILRPS